MGRAAGARRHLRRGVAVVLLAVAAMLGVAAPAFAHTRLEGTDPADGSSLAEAPQRVSLTFNENLPAEFSAITVIGPDGAAYQSGAVSAQGTTISTAVRPLGPAGRYEIGYRVVSDDGHPVEGKVAFTLTAPGPAAAAATSPSAASPAPVAATPAPDGGSAPVWPWIAGAVVLVAAGVTVALRVGRR
ncbi:copper resistance CopC family protein [Pseudonocardia sp.]|uniref:copper resistance CopC family protein n=1 Tax=Pseudonocardia sp. TaxID=60912 RepID=UPI003D0A2D38